jgi:hypothetical protein
MKNALIRHQPQKLLRFQEALVNWQSVFAEILRAHNKELQAQGERYVSRIVGLRHEASLQSIVGLCRGSGYNTYTLCLCWVSEPRDADLRLSVACTCPFFDEVLICKHTYAFTVCLQKEFSAGAKSAFVCSILGNPEPTWIETMQKLDEFLQQPLVHVEPAAQQEKRKSRVGWRVLRRPTKRIDNSLIERLFESISPPSLTLEGFVQTQGKRGGWSRGREVHWTRLPYLKNVEPTPADYEVIRAVGMAYGHSESFGKTLGQAFEALIGHPVVMMHDQPVEVRRAQFGLAVIEATEENWRLGLAVDGRPESEFAFLDFCGSHAVAYDEAERALLVAPFEDSLLALVHSLRMSDTEWPSEAQAELLQRLPQLEERLPIVLPDSMKGDWVEADSRLRLRITPRDPAGATIDLCVQPLADGKYFSASDGPVEVVGQRDGQRVHTKRDLDDERLRAESLVKELFLYRFTPVGRFEWTIDSDDEVLDLLDTLRARDEDDPLVVWPPDGKVRRLRVLGEISPSALRVEIKDQHDWFGLSG